MDEKKKKKTNRVKSRGHSSSVVLQTGHCNLSPVGPSLYCFLTSKSWPPGTGSLLYSSRTWGCCWSGGPPPLGSRLVRWARAISCRFCSFNSLCLCSSLQQKPKPASQKLVQCCLSTVTKTSLTKQETFDWIWTDFQHFWSFTKLLYAANIVEGMKGWPTDTLTEIANSYE